MSYFDHPENVEQYIALSKGFDGRDLINVLQSHLPEGSSVLELGMGEGKDVALLSKHFRETGSDASTVFVDRYRAKHPDADVLVLDALSLSTPRQFQAIYSNKVLHQLTPDELKTSFLNQALCLNAEGLIMHSFWQGEGFDTYEGSYYQYYQPSSVIKMLEQEFEIIDCQTYQESEPDDSFWVLARKQLFEN